MEGLAITEIQPMGTYAISPYYEPYIEGIIDPNDLVKSRIEQISNEIMDFYQERPYVVICVLKGSIMVFTELIQKLSESYHVGKYKNHVQYEFVKLSSYYGDQSSGVVSIQGLDGIELTGKELLVVEDIVDTGLSMVKFFAALKDSKPKSVKLFSLLLKENRTKFPFIVDYVGFVVPDTFIVGWGLDYNQNFRDVLHICAINQKGIDQFRLPKKEEVIVNTLIENGTKPKIEGKVEESSSIENMEVKTENLEVKDEKVEVKIESKIGEILQAETP